MSLHRRDTYGSKRESFISKHYETCRSLIIFYVHPFLVQDLASAQKLKEHYVFDSPL